MQLLCKSTFLTSSQRCWKSQQKKTMTWTHRVLQAPPPPMLTTVSTSILTTTPTQFHILQCLACSPGKEVIYEIFKILIKTRTSVLTSNMLFTLLVNMTSTILLPQAKRTASRCQKDNQIKVKNRRCIQAPCSVNVGFIFVLVLSTLTFALIFEYRFFGSLIRLCAPVITR